MFTKTMLKRAIHETRRNSRCYAVLGGVAYEIKAVVSSDAFGDCHPHPKLWFVVGSEAGHMPPLEVHQPVHWLNRRHKEAE